MLWMGMLMRAIDAGILVCGDCHQLNRLVPDADEQRCRRCGAALHARQPDSLRRTWALLLTATILYIPANVLDIMTINLFGNPAPSTIMGGVIELIHADMLPIAFVKFRAFCGYELPFLGLTFKNAKICPRSATFLLRLPKSDRSLEKPIVCEALEEAQLVEQNQPSP